MKDHDHSTKSPKGEDENPTNALLALDVNFKTEIKSEQIMLAVQRLEKKIMAIYLDVKQIFIII